MVVPMNLFAGQQWRQRHRADLGPRAGERTERKRGVERGAWQRTLPHVKESRWDLLYDSGSSNWGSVTA